ncbi:hypothetical protein F8388_014624 [Cannabis sativa]|uniref:DUF4283 domain-containing protein n=1 Tax=Cannabis sativa TaxID=3483 RepID=A0A7J6EJ27_CANSA|nr:hypothetical protein F8388_014624 [Cannabis sativa]KAF4361961.1 hypothetical protein G4B88_024537 [Cannabis sativa]
MISKTVVGRFISKKVVSKGTLRKALTGMWKLTPGWHLQAPVPKTYISHLNSPKKVKFVLENGPWGPCSGFMMVATLSKDGKWESTDLSALDIWIKVKLNLIVPFLVGVSLLDMGTKKKRTTLARKGWCLSKIVNPLGSRLEKGFALLEVEDL